MGHIEETKDRKRAGTRYWRAVKGNLYARLQYQDETGKWREKLRPISDKRTARSIVEDMRQELLVHGHETLSSDKLTFNELGERYAENKLKDAEYSNGIKVAGKRSLIPVRSALKTLIEHFGSKIIRSIRPIDLDAFKQKRLKTPLNNGSHRKIASVNRELELLRAMLNFAVQNEWLIKNPFSLTKGLISKAAETERDRILSFEEERRLFEVCVGKRRHLKPLLICALDTAMRRGEIFKMKWKDIGFDANEIYIPQTNTKTEESRSVGITPRLKYELEQLWEASPQDLDQTVFGITNTVKTAFLSACREANIQDFRFHDCRHTATTRMIASGSPHTEVMKITGHSQLKTFIRYLNITSEMTGKVASRLDNYISERQITVDFVSEGVS